MVIGNLLARSAAQKNQAEPRLRYLSPPETEMRSPVTQADWSKARRSATMWSPQLRQIRVDERHAAAPSPIAPPTRFTDPDRTSPTAYTPGTLDSRAAGAVLQQFVRALP